MTSLRSLLLLAFLACGAAAGAQAPGKIGGSPWQYPTRYIENSPLFYADRIQTPLFIMHNDADGAVPWYQGIEMFIAPLRLA